MRVLISQASRYGAAAVLVAVTYIGLTLVLSGPVGAPIQLVIPVALAIAVVLHFVLQRRFVFAARGTFALSRRAQVQRYAVIVPAQYAGTAVATAVLPPVLDTSEQTVYVGAVCVISAATFLFLRSSVFHPT